jgi:hypothetical protein
MKVSKLGVAVALLYTFFAFSLFTEGINCHGFFCVSTQLSMWPWSMFGNGTLGTSYFWPIVTVNAAILYFTVFLLQKVASSLFASK